MTSFTWTARDRHVVGVSAAPAADVPVVLRWGSDPSNAASSLPWSSSEFPTLLIHAIGLELTEYSGVATATVGIRLDHVDGGVQQFISPSGAVTSATKRFDWMVGVVAGLQGLNHLDVLPRGLRLLPGLVRASPSLLTIRGISGSPGGAGWQLGPVTIVGSLLYP